MPVITPLSVALRQKKATNSAGPICAMAPKATSPSDDSVSGGESNNMP